MRHSLAPAGGVLARVFIVKRVANAEWVVQERADDEFSDRRSGLLGKA